MKKGMLKQKDKACVFNTCYGMYLDKFREDEELKDSIPLTEQEFSDELIEVSMDEYAKYVEVIKSIIYEAKGDDGK